MNHTGNRKNVFIRRTNTQLPRERDALKVNKHNEQLIYLCIV